LGLGLKFGFFGFLSLGLGLGGKPKFQTQNPMFFKCQRLVVELKKYIIIISQCSRQETNTLSPEGLPMSNIAEHPSLA